MTQEENKALINATAMRSVRFKATVLQTPIECKKCGAVTVHCIYCYDTGSSGDRNYAYNLYACDACGVIIKEDVWEKAGSIFINLDGSVERE